MQRRGGAPRPPGAARPAMPAQPRGTGAPRPSTGRHCRAGCGPRRRATPPTRAGFRVRACPGGSSSSRRSPGPGRRRSRAGGTPRWWRSSARGPLRRSAGARRPGRAAPPARPSARPRSAGGGRRAGWRVRTGGPPRRTPACPGAGRQPHPASRRAPGRPASGCRRGSGPWRRARSGARRPRGLRGTHGTPLRRRRPRTVRTPGARLPSRPPSPAAPPPRDRAGPAAPRWVAPRRRPRRDGPSARRPRGRGSCRPRVLAALTASVRRWGACSASRDPTTRARTTPNVGVCTDTPARRGSRRCGRPPVYLRAGHPDERLRHSPELGVRADGGAVVAPLPSSPPCRQSRVGTPRMLNPPSTYTTSPVTAEERSEPRYTAVLPTSSIVMWARSGAIVSNGP